MNNGWQFYSGDEVLRNEKGLYQLTNGEDRDLELLKNIMLQVQKYKEPTCIMVKGEYYAVFRRDNWKRIKYERDRELKIM